MYHALFPATFPALYRYPTPLLFRAIQAVLLPAFRIVLYIVANAFQIILITDDMLPAITLPIGTLRVERAVCRPRHRRLEPTDNRMH